MSISPVHVVGFAGSTRRGSYNRGLLRAAEELLPAGMTLEILDLSPLPFYNDDQLQTGAPESVRRFKERIRYADALLIATPEYNYGVPALLKNALDWASRPVAENVLNDKPLALMGASTGNYGTVRVQLQLRQTAVFTNMHPINKPEVLVTRAAEKFDAEGRLRDESTREVVRLALESLAAWTRRLQAGLRALEA